MVERLIRLVCVLVLFTLVKNPFTIYSSDVVFTPNNSNPQLSSNPIEINDIVFSRYNSNSQLVLDYYNYILNIENLP